MGFNVLFRFFQSGALMTLRMEYLLSVEFFDARCLLFAGWWLRHP